MSSRTTRGTQKTLAVGVIRDFFRESPLPDTNEFIEEFVMRHSYTYEYPDTPQGQRMWQQYHGDKINKEARQAILAKFGGKRGPVKSDPADDVAEDAQGEAVETAAATEEDESPATKEFVTQGEYADTDSDASDGHFSLPLPVDQDVLNTNKDFQLPWNIYCPTGNVKPKSWKSIKRNIFIDVEPPKPSTLKSICACVDRCDESCLNKMLQFECDSSNCPFGDVDCGNREFGLLKNRTSRFYHQAIEIIHTESKGYGLRACRSFAPGELVCEYTGDVISPSEIKRRLDNEYADSDNYYFLNLEKGAVIDSGLRGSAARFVNHSCMPNCEMQKWFVKGLPRVGLFAGEDGVQNGQELTYDYNFVWFEGAKAQTCHCGASQCRGIIGRRAGEKATTERASSVGAIESSSRKRASTADVVTPKRGRPKKSGSDSPKLHKPRDLDTPIVKARDKPRDQRVTPRSRDSLKRDLLKRDLLAVPKTRDKSRDKSADKKKRLSLPAKLGKSKLRESLSAADAAIATTPKKRGRPRKVTVEGTKAEAVSVEEGVDEDSVIIDESTVDPVTPPKRGRPPKTRSQSGGKKKRGRPAKIQVKDESHHETEVSEINKKSPAEPKKSETPTRRLRNLRNNVTLHVGELLEEEPREASRELEEVGEVAAAGADDSDMETFQDAHEDFQEASRARAKYTATPDLESHGHSSSDQDYTPTGAKKPVKKRTQRARRSTANYESTMVVDESDDDVAIACDPTAVEEDKDDEKENLRRKKRRTTSEIEYVETTSPSDARRKNRRRVTLNKDYRIPDYNEDSDEDLRGVEKEVKPENAVSLPQGVPPENLHEIDASLDTVPDAPPGSFRSFSLQQPLALPRTSKVVDRNIKGIRQLHQLSKEGGQFSTGRFRVDRSAPEPARTVTTPMLVNMNVRQTPNPSTPIQQGNPSPPAHPSPGHHGHPGHPVHTSHGYYYDPGRGYYPPPIEQYSPPQLQPPRQPQYHTPGSVEDLLFPASLYPENLPDRQKNGKTIPRSKRKAPVRYSDVKKDEMKNSASPVATNPNPGHVQSPAPVAQSPYPSQVAPPSGNPPHGYVNHGAQGLPPFGGQYPPTPQPGYYPGPPPQPQCNYGGPYYYPQPSVQPNYGYASQAYPQGYPPPGLVAQATPAPVHETPFSSVPNPAVAPPNLGLATAMPGAVPVTNAVHPVNSSPVAVTPVAPGVPMAPISNPSPPIAVAQPPEMSPATSPTSSRLPPISSLVNTTSTSKSPAMGTLPPPRLSIGKPGEGRRLSSTNLPLPTRQNRRFYGPV
ncbi:hypothetical protein B0I72DRAFT_110831 [Yarrowia lipolytica]|uniref:YALI0D21684p n=1 Tax=Yarrowia lipolytica (strain CLIB 122 / E 150) TaxID=284591 RepID=W0TYN1_YARLI|nr:YALI0D21684p [Yarrowia lipolytica CLIB122]RDW33280.1 hypothetical protein B0I72DRAFT_110831 [Yarrowia lipolytica]RDW40714.1 hypothetical protein B0I73DRAFT_116173 [Yarrowia lipolytica]CAG81317.4 YALI0D21684p [Yarrowia lipolytica CLIB122]|eukprot:XP_002143056.1 YALI0D21684p [Yarrowia lipolytica CLIB122]